MSKHQITLNDRFDLTKSPVLMNGTQALVRLMLMQKEPVTCRAIAALPWVAST